MNQSGGTTSIRIENEGPQCIGSDGTLNNNNWALFEQQMENISGIGIKCTIFFKDMISSLLIPLGSLSYFSKIITNNNYCTLVLRLASTPRDDKSITIAVQLLRSIIYDLSSKNKVGLIEKSKKIYVEYCTSHLQ